MSFLRAEDCVCATTTTGTGTLALAACPTPPGGVDPYQAFNGLGLGTSQATPMTYCIREFMDATFAAVKQEEKGVGALTLGANIGATTLARTTPQSTATGCNTSTPTYSQGAPSAINIGTAANTLVFIGASAADIPAYCPYFETGIGDNIGVGGVCGAGNNNAQAVVSGTDIYDLVDWRCPMLVKRAWVRVATAYSGGTPVSNAWCRLYSIGSNGRPGKLLYDFGLFGTANTSLNTAGLVSTGAAGNGFMMLPGEYFVNFLPIFSGGTTGPNLNCYAANTKYSSGRLGRSTGQAILATSATGAAGGAGPDPANTTGYAAVVVATTIPVITFSPS
jgi:hypothetical protein